MINVAVTDQKVVVRVLADLFANFRFAFIKGEVDDGFARRHGGSNGPVFHIEHVFDHRLFIGVNDALIAAGAHRRENVVRGELILWCQRNIEKTQHCVCQIVKNPDKGADDGAEDVHGHGHQNGVALGVVHGQALGQEVRQQHHGAGDQQKRADKTQLGRSFRRQDVAKCCRKIGGKSRFADDTAHDGGHVVTDLDD